MLVSTVNPFSIKGQWYKGNLHTHTTNSDGRLSLKEITSSYRKREYDFLVITDHEKVTNIDEYSTSNNPLLIQGMEICCGHSEIEELYHIVAVGLKEAPELPEKVSTQEVINIIRRQQGIAFLGHLYWSGLTLNDILPLKEILGIEVFNTRCLRGQGKGLSAVHWDDLLAREKHLYGVAVDDTHFQEDIGQGWIMVKSGNLSVENILFAIKEGQFYSSCGPVIENISSEDNAVTVTCSEVIAINFICDTFHGASFLSEDGKLLTGASYNLSGQERYLRIEVIDAQGKTAWSQPLFYQEIKRI